MTMYFSDLNVLIFSQLNFFHFKFFKYVVYIRNFQTFSSDSNFHSMLILNFELNWFWFSFHSSRSHKLPVTWLNFQCIARCAWGVHCTPRTRCAFRLNSVQSESVLQKRTFLLPMGHFSVFTILNPTHPQDPSTENTANWGEMMMASSKWGKHRQNDDLVGIMASDQKAITMAACVLLHHAYLVLEPKWRSRGLKRRGKDPSSLWWKIFHISTLIGMWERSNMTNHCSWSESRDFSRGVTKDMSKWIENQVTWPATVFQIRSGLIGSSLGFRGDQPLHQDSWRPSVATFHTG